MPLAFPLAVYRGDTFTSPRFVLWHDAAGTQPVDLTGCTVTAQARPAADCDRVVDFDCVVTLPNTVYVSLDAAASATMTTGVWDMQVLDSVGQVTTYVCGPVAVTPDITQP